MIREISNLTNVTTSLTLLSKLLLIFFNFFTENLHIKIYQKTVNNNINVHARPWAVLGMDSP